MRARVRAWGKLTVLWDVNWPRPQTAGSSGSGSPAHVDQKYYYAARVGPVEVEDVRASQRAKFSTSMSKALEETMFRRMPDEANNYDTMTYAMLYATSERFGAKHGLRKVRW